MLPYICTFPKLVGKNFGKLTVTLLCSSVIFFLNMYLLLKKLVVNGGNFETRSVLRRLTEEYLDTSFKYILQNIFGFINYEV